MELKYESGMELAVKNPDELDLVYGDYQVRAWWD